LLKWDEQFVVRVFEFVMTSELGRSVGSFKERNGLDQSGLSIDGTYDEVEPPLALEITGLHREGEPELATAQEKMEEYLTHLGEAEALGDWLVVVRVGVRVKDVLPQLSGLIREGKSIRTDDHGSAELLSMTDDERSAFLNVHRWLKASNIVNVSKLAEKPNRVHVIAFGRNAAIEGIRDALHAALAANAAKLGQSRPRETHLAVLVHDAHASRFESETRPPTLPREVDYLWVIHTCPGADGRVPVWRLERGGSTWSVLPLPPEILTGS
jgi:hypothetical protein